MPKDMESNHTESYTTEAQPQLERNSGFPQKRGNVLYMPATAEQSRERIANGPTQTAIPTRPPNKSATTTGKVRYLYNAPSKKFTWKDHLYLSLVRFARWAGWLRALDPKRLDIYIKKQLEMATRQNA